MTESDEGSIERGGQIPMCCQDLFSDIRITRCVMDYSSFVIEELTSVHKNVQSVVVRHDK